MAMGFRGSPKQARRSYEKKIESRARAFRRDPDRIAPEEEASRRRADRKLEYEGIFKGDFGRVLADRQKRYIENKTAFEGQRAQQERLDYLADVFTEAAGEFQNGNLDLVGFVAYLAPTLVMMHKTGGIRNGLSEMWHMKMADQAKSWYEADPKRYGKFYAKCQAYREGDRIPYDSHTAALDSVALDTKHYKDVRREGLTDSERSAIEAQYARDKEALGKMFEADGVDHADLVEQQHKLVATMVVRDPKYAVMYGICPGSKEYQEAVEATGAEFGPNGASDPPKRMHAANVTLDWPEDKYVLPRAPRDAGYYRDTMRNGVAAFSQEDAVALDAGEKKGTMSAAKEVYWLGRMRADGIPYAQAVTMVAKVLDERFRETVPTVEAEAMSEAEARAAGAKGRRDADFAEVPREDFMAGLSRTAVLRGAGFPDGLPTPKDVPTTPQAPDDGKDYAAGTIGPVLFGDGVGGRSAYPVSVAASRDLPQKDADGTGREAEDVGDGKARSSADRLRRYAKSAMSRYSETGQAKEIDGFLNGKASGPNDGATMRGPVEGHRSERQRANEGAADRLMAQAAMMAVASEDLGLEMD